MTDNNKIFSETGTKIPMKRFLNEEVVDALVIGTGAGGAPLLARLAMAGLKVVALEAGKHWEPSKDFATDEVSQSKLFWNEERLSDGKNPIAFYSIYAEAPT
jgi:choline dehydrogenase-like flavoprotein